MLRGIRRFAIIGAGLVAVGMATVPASAVGAGAGVVTGTVNLSPGFAFPPAASAPQTFGFASATIAGAGVSVQGTTASCAGAVMASANASGGTTVAENEAAGVGSLTINATGSCTVGSLNVTCGAGTYVRVGVIVVVADAACTVNGDAGAVVVPVSLFIPNQPPPNTVVSALFAGVFTVAGA